MPSEFVRNAHELTPELIVTRASRMAEDLVRLKSKGWGDQDRAIERVAIDFGLPISKITSLVRRPQTLKDVAASVYLKLAAAWAAHCEHQLQAQIDETEETAAMVGRDHIAVRSSMALARAAGLQVTE